MSKHTKAPWKVVENGGRMVGVMSKNDWVVYKAGQDRMSTEEIEANACLIAAAPDLLEALYGMLLHIREPESESEFQWPDHFRKQKDAFIAARAAIATALGK